MLTALAVALCALLLITAQAWADAPVLNTTFDGSPDHTVGSVGRVAADEVTGDVYVIDSANDAVDRFSSTGTFLGALRGSDTPNRSFGFGGEDDIAVDNSGGVNQGHVYLDAELGGTQTILAYDQNGNLLWYAPTPSTPPGADICGIAVNPTGDLFVGDFNNGVYQLSTTDGSPTGNTLAPPGNVCHIAFDSSDNLFVNHYSGNVDRYDAPSYSTFTTIEPLSTSGVATDSTNGDSYMNLGGQIDAYDSTGTAISGTPFDVGKSLNGVTVAGAFGKIFVSDATDTAIQVFDRVGGAAPKPTARTGSADNVGSDAATVHGATNPNGADTTCRVEYGTDPSSLDSSQDCAAGAGSGTSEAPVSADLTGLAASTTYYYRLVTTSTAGTTNGTVSSFTTTAPPPPPSPPRVTTGSATGVTQTAATIGGTVNAEGVSTTCAVQYGTTTSYGSTAPCSSALSGSSPQAISVALSGLTPGTTYHYRVVATNVAGTTNGGDATFTTQPQTIPPPPPPPATLKLLGSATITVVGGKAPLKLSCVGDSGATCTGTVALTVRIKVHRKLKTVTIGKASVNLTAGGKKTVTIKLSSTGKKLLAKSRSHKLKAALAGPNRLKRTVVLKLKVVKKHKKH